MTSLPFGHTRTLCVTKNGLDCSCNLSYGKQCLGTMLVTMKQARKKPSCFTLWLFDQQLLRKGHCCRNTFTLFPRFGVMEKETRARMCHIRCTFPNLSLSSTSLLIRGGLAYMTHTQTMPCPVCWQKK